VLSLSDCGTIVRKRKLVLELTRHSTATHPKRGSNNDARIITEQIMVLLYISVSSYWLELMQRGFPTNCPPWWLALYGYLRFFRLVTDAPLSH
jgi:hypothetical protein